MARRPAVGAIVVFSAICALMMAAFPAEVRSGEPSGAKMPEKHAAFFREYCVRCHNAEEESGKVRLDTIPFEVGRDVQTADTWQKILNALNAGAMPPEYEPQPEADETAAFLEDLSETMVAAREKLADGGGSSVMRRLNRREYRNTIRDLLGVGVDVTELPADTGTGSFDTVGTSLYFSPDQFEIYLKLGREALGEAIVGSGESRPRSRTTRSEVEEWANRTAAEYIEKYQDLLERHKEWMAAEGKRPASDFGFLDEPRARRAKKLYDKNAPYYYAYRTWPEIERGTYFSQIHSTIAVGFSEEHPPGDYLARIRVGATEDAPERRRFIEFGEVVDVGGRTDFAIASSHQVTGTVEQPQIIEVPVTLGASGGRDFHFREMRPDHKMPNFRKNPVVPDPVLWVDWVEIEGPLIREWPPKSHRRIFFDEDRTAGDAGYAREIIRRFARRAFRGKEPQPEFVDRVVSIYRQHREAGSAFEEGVQEALAVVLASPDFLYLSETETGPLTDRQLAVRLAYLLWSAPPDEALLAAAREGSLREPEGLRAEVERMLEDPRHWEFVTGFTHQWLDLDRIDLFQFDEERYPDFVESTKIAAVNEVYHFFDTLLRENLSARHFLKSNFVVVNGLMAEYYGMEGVEGKAWRKRPAPPERAGGPAGDGGDAGDGLRRAADQPGGTGGVCAAETAQRPAPAGPGERAAVEPAG